MFAWTSSAGGRRGGGGGWRRANAMGIGRGQPGGFTDVFPLRNELENSESSGHHHHRQPSLGPRAAPAMSSLESSLGAQLGGNHSIIIPGRLSWKHQGQTSFSTPLCRWGTPLTSSRKGETTQTQIRFCCLVQGGTQQV